MLLETLAVNRYGLRRSFTNTRNCPWQVIRSFVLLTSSLTFPFFPPSTERTAKILIGDLKSRIDTCQKDCTSLKDRFFSIILLDTNIQVKEMKGDKLGAFELLSAII